VARIRGTNGDDDISGTGGDDTIFGLADDNIDGGLSSVGETGTNRLFGGDGSDFLSLLGEGGFASGGTGDDVILQSIGGRAEGGPGHDYFNLFATASFNTGGPGADTFTVSAFSSGEQPAERRDTILDFDPALDVVALDMLDAREDLDGIQPFQFLGTAPFSGAGQVRYEVEDGTTTVEANLLGNGLANIAVVLPGELELTAANFLLGETSSDAPETLLGTRYGDSVDGLGGADTIRTFGGADTVQGDGRATGAGDLIDLGNGRDFGNGGEGDDTVLGGAGRDEVQGGEGDDDVRGGAGDDFVLDIEGGDRLSGGRDDDRLLGGGGGDTYVGGGGRDVFVLSPSDIGAAVLAIITDFAEADRIDVTELAEGRLDFVGQAAPDAGEIGFVRRGGDTVLRVADGDLVRLEGNVTLDAGDFLL
jgi:Ca2+-binding RTX toxin-like protein